MAKWVCQKAKIAGVITTADLQNCYYFKYAIIKFPTAKKKTGSAAAIIEAHSPLKLL